MNDNTYKLSPATIELHESMSRGVICTYHRYMGRFNPTPYYTRSDTSKRCTRQAESLLKRGLVEKFHDTWKGHFLRAVAPKVEPVIELPPKVVAEIFASGSVCPN